MISFSVAITSNDGHSGDMKPETRVLYLDVGN